MKLERALITEKDIMGAALLDEQSKPLWRIHEEEIAFLECIGSGSFGIVYKGRWRGTIVAIKEYFGSWSPGDEEVTEETSDVEGDKEDEERSRVKSALKCNWANRSAAKEMEALSRLRHPNLLLFLGAVETTGNCLLIVTEYLPNGSLWDFLHSGGLSRTMRWDSTTQVQMVKDIALGLNHLHASSYIHGDVKSPNMLITADMLIKVADFGTSTWNHRIDKFSEVDQSGEIMGSPLWSAPELLRGEASLSYAADVYAFGVVCWEVFSGCVPFDNLDINRMRFAVALEGRVPQMDRLRPETPNFLETIISRCFAPNPNDRPPIAELMKIITAFSVPAMAAFDVPLRQATTRPVPMSKPPFTASEGDLRVRYRAMGSDRGSGVSPKVFSRPLLETRSEHDLRKKLGGINSSRSQVESEIVQRRLIQRTNDMEMMLNKPSRDDLAQSAEALKSKITLQTIMPSVMRIADQAGISLGVISQRDSNSNKNVESMLIDSSEIELVDTLYVGASGRLVRLGVYKGKKVAMKSLIYVKAMDKKTAKEFVNEINALMNLRHPNLMEMKGFICSDDTSKLSMHIVLEYMSRGSVWDMLESYRQRLALAPENTLPPHMSPRLQLSLALDVAKGCAFMHSHTPPAIHRDIKTANLFIGDSWQCKIGDFGLSKFKVGSKATTRCGSPAYTAPEVLLGKPYNEKIDVYGYGMALFEIHTATLPFEEQESTIALMQSVAYEGARPEYNTPPETELDVFWRDLVNRCWDQDPEKRPSFNDIIIRLQAFCEGSFANHLETDKGDDADDVDNHDIKQ